MPLLERALDRKCLIELPYYLAIASDDLFMSNDWQIDRLVYDLYGLTDDDIAVVEAAQ